MTRLWRSIFGLFDPKPEPWPELEAAIGRVLARAREETEARGW